MIFLGPPHPPSITDIHTIAYIDIDVVRLSCEWCGSNFKSYANEIDYRSKLHYYADLEEYMSILQDFCF